MTQEDRDTLGLAVYHSTKAYLNAMSKFERTGEQKWLDVTKVFEETVYRLVARMEEQ